MQIENIKKELTKNIRKRIEYLFLLAIPFFFLFDELAKEDYFFRLSDVFQMSYISHEQLIIVSVLIGFVVRWINGNSVRPEAAH